MLNYVDSERFRETIDAFPLSNFVGALGNDPRRSSSAAAYAHCTLPGSSTFIVIRGMYLHVDCTIVV